MFDRKGSPEYKSSSSRRRRQTKIVSFFLFFYYVRPRLTQHVSIFFLFLFRRRGWFIDCYPFKRNSIKNEKRGEESLKSDKIGFHERVFRRRTRFEEFGVATSHRRTSLYCTNFHFKYEAGTPRVQERFSFSFKLEKGFVLAYQMSKTAFKDIFDSRVTIP